MDTRAKTGERRILQPVSRAHPQIDTINCAWAPSNAKYAANGAGRRAFRFRRLDATSTSTPAARTLNDNPRMQSSLYAPHASRDDSFHAPSGQKPAESTYLVHGCVHLDVDVVSELVRRQIDRHGDIPLLPKAALEKVPGTRRVAKGECVRNPSQNSRPAAALPCTKRRTWCGPCILDLPAYCSNS